MSDQLQLTLLTENMNYETRQALIHVNIITSILKEIWISFPPWKKFSVVFNNF